MTTETHDSDNLNHQLSRMHFRTSFETHFKSEFHKMRILLNELFSKKIWTSDIKKVKEPNRSKKLRELCNKMIQEHNIKLNERIRKKVYNGVRDFCKTWKEVEIEIEEEDGKFFE